MKGLCNFGGPFHSIFTRTRSHTHTQLSYCAVIKLAKSSTHAICVCVFDEIILYLSVTLATNETQEAYKVKREHGGKCNFASFRFPSRPNFRFFETIASRFPGRKERFRFTRDEMEYLFSFLWWMIILCLWMTVSKIDVYLFFFFFFCER